MDNKTTRKFGKIEYNIIEHGKLDFAGYDFEHITVLDKVNKRKTIDTAATDDVFENDFED